MARGCIIGFLAVSLASSVALAAAEGGEGVNPAVLRVSIARQTERLSALSAQVGEKGQSAESLHARAGSLASAAAEAYREPDTVGGGLVVMGGGGNVGAYGAGSRAGFGHVSAPLKGGAGRIGGSFGYGVTYVDRKRLDYNTETYRGRIREFGGFHYQTPEVGGSLRLEAGVRPAQVKYEGRTSAGTIPYVGLTTKHLRENDEGPGFALRVEWGFLRTGVPGVGGQRVMAGVSIGAN